MTTERTSADVIRDLSWVNATIHELNQSLEAAPTSKWASRWWLDRVEARDRLFEVRKRLHREMRRFELEVIE